MADRSRITMTMTDILTRLQNVQKRRPAVVALAATVLAGGIVTGAVLTLGRETETAPLPDLTYQQCGSVQEDARRLTCYDEVLRQTSLRTARGGRRMTFGELLGAQRNDQKRSLSGTQR